MDIVIVARRFVVQESVAAREVILHTENTADESEMYLQECIEIGFKSGGRGRKCSRRPLDLVRTDIEYSSAATSCQHMA